MWCGGPATARMRRTFAAIAPRSTSATRGGAALIARERARSSPLQHDEGARDAGVVAHREVRRDDPEGRESLLHHAGDAERRAPVRIRDDHHVLPGEARGVA